MKKLLSLACLLSLAFTLAADLSDYDLNAPMGWATCRSLTTAGDYQLTGGGSGNSITLKASGGDDYEALKNAINNYSVIILDGSAGDFILSKTINFSKSNRTVVGINHARLCSEFFVTEEIRQLMDANGILDMPSSSGTGGTLSNGTTVNEARETKTRQLLIDYTGDQTEAYRQSGVFYITACSNIIIRNIEFVGPGAIDVGGSDLISIINSANHVWVDHCAFIDGMDGNLDVTVKSDFVTISWCIFTYTDRSYDHRLSNLVAGSDDPDKNGLDNLNITYTNNIWGAGCEGRMPMARFGTIHLLNNYYNCAYAGSTINPCLDSEYLIEANYFEKKVSRIFSDHGAKSFQFRGNYYTESFHQPEDKGSVFIPYAYPVYDVQQVPAVLTSEENGAGPTLSDPLNIGRENYVFPESYYISYQVDGKMYHEDYLSYGDSIPQLIPAEKKGYTFSGWSMQGGEVPATMPKENIIIEGYFTPNTYALRYYVDNELYATDSLPYKALITLRDFPEKEGCVFTGWLSRQNFSAEDYWAVAAQVDNQSAGIVSDGALLPQATILAQSDAAVMKTGAEDTYKPSSVWINGITQAVVGEAVLPLNVACQGATNPKDASGGQCDANVTPPAQGAFLCFDVNTNGYLYVFHRASSHKTYMVSEEDAVIGYEFAMYTEDAPWGNFISYVIEGDEDYYVTDASKLQWPEKIVLGDAWEQAAGAEKRIAINGVGVIKFPVVAGLQYKVNACGSKITCAGFLFSNADQDVYIADDAGNQILLLESAQTTPLTAPSRMPAFDWNLYGSFSPATDIMAPNAATKVNIYNLQGQLLHRQVSVDEVESQLQQGVYVIDRSKVFLK